MQAQFIKISYILPIEQHKLRVFDIERNFEKNSQIETTCDHNYNLTQDHLNNYSFQQEH